jgi:DNA-binding Xre family transcriptional regulator
MDKKTPYRSEIERLMSHKNIAFLELSRKSGIPAQQLSPIVKGTTKTFQLATLQKLCIGLECTPNDIYKNLIKF